MQRTDCTFCTFVYCWRVMQVDEHGHAITSQSTSCCATFQQAQMKIEELNSVIASLEQQLRDQALQQQRFTINDIKDNDANVSTVDS